jgi:hypothetical protein
MSFCQMPYDYLFLPTHTLKLQTRYEKKNSSNYNVKLFFSCQNMANPLNAHSEHTQPGVVNMTFMCQNDRSYISHKSTRISHARISHDSYKSTVISHAGHAGISHALVDQNMWPIILGVCVATGYKRRKCVKESSE